VQIAYFIVTGILAVWVAFLSWQVSRSKKLFDSLTNIKAGSLREVLAEILKTQQASKKEFKELYDEVARIDKQKARAVQRIGLIRFSPFGKDELEQSFSLALLDEFGNGAVLTNIHTRDKARIYAKAINRGKSETTLSAEEDRAIRIALKK
jgi:hypothetical protein